jgi:hypothetical protein
VGVVGRGGGPCLDSVGEGCERGCRGLQTAGATHWPLARRLLSNKCARSPRVEHHDHPQVQRQPTKTPAGGVGRTVERHGRWLLTSPGTARRRRRAVERRGPCGPAVPGHGKVREEMDEEDPLALSHWMLPRCSRTRGCRGARSRPPGGGCAQTEIIIDPTRETRREPVPQGWPGGIGRPSDHCYCAETGNLGAI